MKWLNKILKVTTIVPNLFILVTPGNLSFQRQCNIRAVDISNFAKNFPPARMPTLHSEHSPNSRQIGQILIDRGLISETQLKLALMEQSVTREPLGQVLYRLGFIRRDALIDALLDQGPDALSGEELFSNKIPPSLLVEMRVMLIAEHGNTLYAATDSPISIVRDMLEEYFPQREIEFISFDPRRFEHYLERLNAFTRNDGLLEKLLQDAIARHVSDIHIMPKEESFLVMFRYLGVRYPEYEGSLEDYARLVARIKDKSNLDLAERRIPQDGSFSYHFESKNVDVRVATVPVIQGEYLVLRILDPDHSAPSVEDLGITRVAEWRAGISRSNGLCLVCGPTGSGKTTTLNASLKELDRFGKAVFTVEDPVEYRESFVGQVNVNPSINLDFSRALKAFMRADPDIIVLGEIRDIETARNAMRAAETGHLVLATLHTESIFGAVQRLADIGIPRHELIHLLRAVLVQRLVRVTCKHCQGEGCDHCHGYGYSGRTVVSECAYFPTTESVRKMAQDTVDWPTLIEDAIDKCRAGITDEREILRIFGEEARPYLDGSHQGVSGTTSGGHD